MSEPISVFLITLNEVEHIEQVLERVAWADEVVVLDSGSTDGTVEICKRVGVDLHHQDWLGYSAQKAAALQRCRNDWCLNVDGDEIVSAELAKELQDWTASKEISAVEISINDSIMGKFLSRFSRNGGSFDCSADRSRLIRLTVLFTKTCKSVAPLLDLNIACIILAMMTRQSISRSKLSMLGCGLKINFGTARAAVLLNCGWSGLLRFSERFC